MRRLGTVTRTAGGLAIVRCDDGDGVPDIAFAESLSGSHGPDGQPKRLVMAMDRVLPWTLLAVAIIAVAYGPTVIDQIGDYTPVRGIQLW